MSSSGSKLNKHFGQSCHGSAEIIHSKLGKGRRSAARAAERSTLG